MSSSNRPGAILKPMLVILALAASAIIVSPALANSGMVFRKVITNNDPGVSGLTGPLHAEMSPDGKHLLVSGHFDNAVAVLNRDAITGELTFNSAVFNGDDQPGGQQVVGLNLPDGLAISPDGKHVYVAAQEEKALVIFSRDAGSGLLTFVDAILEGDITDAGGNKVRLRPTWVVVSPDGAHVYAVAQDEQSITVFSRSSADGALTYVETLANGQSSGGQTITGLAGALHVDASPDGKTIYVAGFFDNAVAVFSRNASSGALTFEEALRDGGTDGSGNQLTGLDKAIAVIVSPDNRFVYAVARGDNALTVFSRNTTTGRLTHVQTLKDGGTDSRNNTIDGLFLPQGISVSPNGKNVYVTGRGENALAVFNVNASTGELTFSGAVFDGQPDAAGNTVEGLGGAISASSDNRFVYVLGFVDNAVSTFSRETPDVEVTPLAVDFGSQLVNTTSTPRTVTLSNKGLVGLKVSTISATGDFAQTNSCPAVLAPGASCDIVVTFTPTAAGTRNGSLTIETDAPNSPSIVSLTGVGTQPGQPPPGPTPTILYGNMDVRLDGTPFPTAASVGDVVTWSYVIANIGQGQTIGLVFKAQLDPALSFRSASVSQGTHEITAEGFVWYVEVIPEGGAASVSIQASLASAPAGGGQACVLGSVIQEARQLCVTTSPARLPAATPTPAAPSVPSTPDLVTETYVVRRGDTLFSIARRFGTTVDALVAINNLADPSRISAGQVLQLRATPTPPPLPTPLPSATPSPTPVPAAPATLPPTTTEPPVPSGVATPVPLPTPTPTPPFPPRVVLYAGVGAVVIGVGLLAGIIGLALIRSRSR